MVMRIPPGVNEHWVDLVIAGEPVADIGSGIMPCSPVIW